MLSSIHSFIETRLQLAHIIQCIQKTFKLRIWLHLSSVLTLQSLFIHAHLLFLLYLLPCFLQLLNLLADLACLPLLIQHLDTYRALMMSNSPDLRFRLFLVLQILHLYTYHALVYVITFLRSKTYMVTKRTHDITQKHFQVRLKHIVLDVPNKGYINILAHVWSPCCCYLRDIGNGCLNHFEYLINQLELCNRLLLRNLDGSC